MNLSTDIFEKSVWIIIVACRLCRRNQKILVTYYETKGIENISIFSKSTKNLLKKKCRKIPYLSDFAASTLYIEYDIIFQLFDVFCQSNAL